MNPRHLSPLLILMLATTFGCARRAANSAARPPSADKTPAAVSTPGAKGDKVEYRGLWLTVQAKFSGTGFTTLVVFMADGPTQATGVNYFGFYDSELPKEHTRTDFNAMKGVRGRSAGTTNMVHNGNQILVSLVSNVEVLLK